jgi:D-alanyl-D-alanine carboxypeptidase (penicillin-binding protein 5/6)
LNWGYTAFDAVKLFDAGKPVATPAVWKGTAEHVLKIGREEAIVVAVPSGSAGKVTTQIVRPGPAGAPYTKGQAIGSLKVVLGDQSAGRSAAGGAGGGRAGGASWAGPGTPSDLWIK